MDYSLLFFPCLKVTNTFVLPSWPWVSQDTKGGSQDTFRQHWTSLEHPNSKKGKRKHNYLARERAISYTASMVQSRRRG